MIDVTEHMALAQYVVKNLYPKFRHRYEYEDILQIAYLGLIKAANKYDESFGAKFSTYAFKTMFGEIIRYVQEDKRFNKSRGIPLDKPLLSFECEYKSGNLSNMIGNGFEGELIEKMELEEIVKSLSETEKKIFKLYFINDFTQKTIAKIIDTSQNQVSRVKRRIIRKVESALIEINSKQVRA